MAGNTAFPSLSDYGNTYTSASGADIRAMFGDTEIGTLQGISWSISREVAPNYVMGHASPVSFSRGKRGVAGSLIFLTFNKHSFLDAMANKGDGTGQYYAWKDDVRADARTGNISYVGSSLDPKVTDLLTATLGVSGRREFDNTTAKIWTTPVYSDKVPGFDITLVMANEFGASARKVIWGVQIMSEAGGASIDDINLETQMSFIAKDVSHWQALNEPGGLR